MHCMADFLASMLLLTETTCCDKFLWAQIFICVTFRGTIMPFQAVVELSDEEQLPPKPVETAANTKTPTKQPPPQPEQPAETEATTTTKAMKRPVAQLTSESANPNNKDESETCGSKATPKGKAKAKAKAKGQAKAKEKAKAKAKSSGLAKKPAANLPPKARSYWYKKEKKIGLKLSGKEWATAPCSQR